MENDDLPTITEQCAERILVAFGVGLSWISALGLVALVIANVVLR